MDRIISALPKRLRMWAVVGLSAVAIVPALAQTGGSGGILDGELRTPGLGRPASGTKRGGFTHIRSTADSSTSGSTTASQSSEPPAASSVSPGSAAGATVTRTPAGSRRASRGRRALRGRRGVVTRRAATTSSANTRTARQVVTEQKQQPRPVTSQPAVSAPESSTLLAAKKTTLASAAGESAANHTTANKATENPQATTAPQSVPPTQTTPPTQPTPKSQANTSPTKPDPSAALSGLLVDTKKDPFGAGAGIGAGAGDAFKLLLYLLPITGLIVLAVRGLKKLQEKTGAVPFAGGKGSILGGFNLSKSRGNGGSNIRVIESVPVGGMELNLVEVRGRRLLLACSGGNVTLLTEMNEANDAGSDFSSILGDLTRDDSPEGLAGDGLLGATVGSLDDSLRETREAIVRSAQRTLGRTGTRR